MCVTSDCRFNAFADRPVASKHSLVHLLSGKDNKEQAAKTLQSITDAYGPDKPTALIDLNANVWFATSSKVCRACHLVRRIPQGYTNCAISDRTAAVKCYDTKGPGVYRCASLDLIDFAMPIRVVTNLDDSTSEGEVCAVLLFGQYRHAWLPLPDRSVIDSRLGPHSCSADIMRALECVPWLESELETFGLRLRLLARFLEALPCKGNVRITILERDIRSAELMARQECKSSTSYSRLIQENASTRTRDTLGYYSLLSGFLAKTPRSTSGDKPSDSVPVLGLWNWASPSSGDSTMRTYRVEQWAIEPVGTRVPLEGEIWPRVAPPYSHLPPHAEFLRAINFQEALSAQKAETSIWSLKEVPIPPMQQGHISGTSGELEGFEIANPHALLVTEALWANQPDGCRLADTHDFVKNALKSYGQLGWNKESRWSDIMALLQATQIQMTSGGGLIDSADLRTQIAKALAPPIGGNLADELVVFMLSQMHSVLNRTDYVFGSKNFEAAIDLILVAQETSYTKARGDSLFEDAFVSRIANEVIPSETLRR